MLTLQGTAYKDTSNNLYVLTTLSNDAGSVNLNMTPPDSFLFRSYLNTTSNIPSIQYSYGDTSNRYQFNINSSNVSLFYNTSNISTGSFTPIYNSNVEIAIRQSIDNVKFYVNQIQVINQTYSNVDFDSGYFQITACNPIAPTSNITKVQYPNLQSIFTIANPLEVKGSSRFTNITACNVYSSNLSTLSNLAIAASNTSIYASNLAVSNSNQLYPQAAFSSNLAVSNSNTLYPKAIYASNTAVAASNTAFTDRYWTTSNTNIYTASNVGIGTSSTANKLDVLGNIRAFTNTATTAYLIADASGTNAQAGLQLKAGSASSNRATRIDMYNSNYTSPYWTIINDFSQNGTNDIKFVNSNPGTAVMTLTQAGNLSTLGTITEAGTALSTKYALSNALVTASNQLYPQATFGSNTSIYSSNLAVSNSNALYSNITGTSTASSTAIAASNTAYWSSNNLFNKAGGTVTGNILATGKVNVGNYTNINSLSTSGLNLGFDTVTVDFSNTASQFWSNTPVKPLINVQNSALLSNINYGGLICRNFTSNLVGGTGIFSIDSRAFIGYGIVTRDATNSNVESMTWSHNGYVGILNSNPIYALDVNGTVNASTVQSSNITATTIQSSNLFNTSKFTMCNFGNSVYLSTSNGFLGINTSNPQSLLDVNGTINGLSISESNVQLITKYALSNTVSTLSNSLSNYQPMLTDSNGNSSINLTIGSNSASVTTNGDGGSGSGSGFPTLLLNGLTSTAISTAVSIGLNGISVNGKSLMDWSTGAISKIQSSLGDVVMDMVNKYIKGYSKWTTTNGLDVISTTGTGAAERTSLAGDFVKIGQNSIYIDGSNNAIAITPSSNVGSPSNFYVDPTKMYHLSNVAIGSSNISAYALDVTGTINCTDINCLRVTNASNAAIFASNTSVYASNTARVASNTAYWSSNNLFLKTGGTVSGNVVVTSKLNVGNYTNTTSNDALNLGFNTITYDFSNTASQFWSSNPTKSLITLQNTGMASNINYGGLITRVYPTGGTGIFSFDGRAYIGYGIITRDALNSNIESMSWSHNGYVGILNSNPQYQLDVNGTVNASIVQSSNLTDMSNAVMYSSNTSIYSSNTSVYSSNTSVYSSNAAVYSSNTSVYASNSTTWTSNTAVWASNNCLTTTIIGSNIVTNTITVNSNVFCNGTITMSNFGNSVFFNTSNGNLGINNSTPTYNLDVYSTSNTSNGVVPVTGIRVCNSNNVF